MNVFLIRPLTLTRFLIQAQAALETPMTFNFSIDYLPKLLLAVVSTSTILIGNSQLAQAQTAPVTRTINAQTTIVDFDGRTQFGVGGVVPPGVGIIPAVGVVPPGVGIIPGVGVVPPGVGVVPGMGATAMPNIGGGAPGGRGVGIPNVGDVSQPGARSFGITRPR